MLGFRKSKPILNPHQDVPGEVLGHIFAFASTTTLLSCALVSRQARYFAEPQLYKHIDLFNCPIRSAYFLRTIWLRQELLRYVITFRLAERYEKPPGLPPQLWDHLQGHENDFNASYARRSYRVHKLEVAMHLTKAEDITHTWEYRTLEKTLGNQPAWPSLTSFTLLSTREIDYASLLDAIPMIKRLDIGSSSLLWNLERVDRISAHHVLLLEELICSAEAARILVPTRPIRQLVMFITKASGESLGDLIPQVAQSSDTIRLLGLVIKAMKAPGLQVMMSQIGKWLPDVEELYLHMKFRLVSYEQKFLMAEFMSELPSYIAPLRSLRVLDFSKSWAPDIKDVAWRGIRRHDSLTVDKKALMHLGRVCPSLSKVVFPNGCVWIRRQGDLEWVLHKSSSSSGLGFGFTSEANTDSMKPGEHASKTQFPFKKDLKKAWPDGLPFASDPVLARLNADTRDRMTLPEIL